MNIEILYSYLSPKELCILSCCNKEFNQYIQQFLNKNECIKHYINNESISINGNSMKIIFAILFELYNNKPYYENIPYYDIIQRYSRDTIITYGHHLLEPEQDIRLDDFCYGICHNIIFTVDNIDIRFSVLRQQPNKLCAYQSFILYNIDDYDLFAYAVNEYININRIYERLCVLLNGKENMKLDISGAVYHKMYDYLF